MIGLSPEDQEEYDYATKQAFKVLKALVVIVCLIILGVLCYKK